MASSAFLISGWSVISCKGIMPLRVVATISCLSWILWCAFSKKQHFKVVIKLSSKEVENWKESSGITLGNTHWLISFFFIFLVTGPEEHVKAGLMFADLIDNKTWFCLDSCAELCKAAVEDLFADVLTHWYFNVINCPRHCSWSQVPILTHDWQILWAGNVLWKQELKFICLNRIRTFHKSIFVQSYSETGTISLPKCNHHSSRYSNILTIIKLENSIITDWTFRINLISILKSDVPFTQSLLSQFHFTFITNEKHFYRYG